MVVVVCVCAGGEVCVVVCVCGESIRGGTTDADQGCQPLSCGHTRQVCVRGVSVCVCGGVCEWWWCCVCVVMCVCGESMRGGTTDADQGCRPLSCGHTRQVCVVVCVCGGGGVCVCWW